LYINIKCIRSVYFQTCFKQKCNSCQSDALTTTRVISAMCGMSTDSIYHIVRPNEETITGLAMRRKG